MRAELQRVVAQAQADPEALAVMLFGSQARGEAGPASDVDVCLVLDPDVPPDLPASRKRLDYLAGTDLDLTIFQQLPLPVRRALEAPADHEPD